MPLEPPYAEALHQDLSIIHLDMIQNHLDMVALSNIFETARNLLAEIRKAPIVNDGPLFQRQCPVCEQLLDRNEKLIDGDVLKHLHCVQK